MYRFCTQIWGPNVKPNVKFTATTFVVFGIKYETDTYSIFAGNVTICEVHISWKNTHM